MSYLSRYFFSTIGSKQCVGLAGLLLCGFLLVHMSGNMLLFVSPKAYNLYAHFLKSNPLIYVFELILFILFLTHIALSVFLHIKNRGLKQTSNSSKTDKKTSLVAKTLIFQGLVIFVFLILHLSTFALGTYYEVVYDGQKVRDLFRLMVEVFSQPVYVVFYVFSLLILGAHLSHGFISCFQTLGISFNEKILKKVASLFAFLVTCGFISQALYIYFFYKG